MAFWNKKSKPLNKVPTDVPDDWLESKFKDFEKEIEQERDKYPYSSSSTEPTSSHLYSGGTGLWGSAPGSSYIAYSSPTPPPASAWLDPTSLLIFKEGNDIVLKSRHQVPLYKLSKAELELIVPKGTISIASLLLLFLEESEKLENND